MHRTRANGGDYEAVIVGRFLSVVALAFLLAAGVGFLIYIAIAAVILGCAVALTRHWVRKHRERKHPLSKHARAEKAADRALKDIERTINKQ